MNLLNKIWKVYLQINMVNAECRGGQCSSPLCGPRAQKLDYPENLTVDKKSSLSCRSIEEKKV
jgi:hypothetical protein